MSGPERPSGYSLALNALPLVYALCAAVIAWRAGLMASVAWIYLAPPLVARLAITLLGRPQGEALDQGSRAYKVWWLLAQLQMPFNRFTFLEELLRLVPGVYALWLNLWGSKVSALVLWGPGVLALDRHDLHIGPSAILGTRAVLAGHVAVKNEAGQYRLTLAPVEIGPGALIGGNAYVGPGCCVGPGEALPAATFMRPFTRWERGARVKAPRPRAA